MAREIYTTKYNSASYTLRIRFYNNGGGTVPDNFQRTTSSNASSVTVSTHLPDDTPTRSGYTFLGYAYDDPDDDVSKFPGDTVSVTFSRQTTSSSTRTYQDGDFTVHETTYTCANQTRTRDYYAKWAAITYQVDYNANGGSGAPAPQTKTHGETLTLSATEPTRDGYVFSGWATAPDGAAAYQAGGSYTTDAAVTLYAVWATAGSTVTVASSVEIGGDLAVSWNIVDPTYTYRVVISINGAGFVTDYAAGVSSASIHVGSLYYSHITNATSASATVTLYTRSGGSTVGQSSGTTTIVVPASVVPTITSFTASPYSSNTTVNGWGEFLQAYSQADLTVVATPGTGASISLVSFSGTGISQNGTATTARTAVFDSSGTYNYSVTVVDSRGRTATDTVAVTVLPYGRPFVYSIGTERADADGTTNNGGGAYLKVSPVYAKSSVNGNNQFTVQTLSYAVHGSATPVATITCASGSTYGPPSNMWAINLGDAYDITVNITDSLGNTGELTAVLPPAQGIWYGRSNDRLGLGSAPPGPGLYCDWPSHFADEMHLNAKAGSTIHFGAVDATSTSTAFTATIPGISEYYDGLAVMLKNGVVTSASGFTININGLGAKQSYNNMAAATADTTIFNVNYTMLFIYDSTRVAGGGWLCYRGYNSDTNTIGYQIRTNSTVLPIADKSRYYRLMFTSADNTKWVPANTGTDNSATSTKTVNQRAINPFGRIIYYSASTNMAQGADVNASYCWAQYAFALGYSFNKTGSALTLTTKTPVYIKCAPQSDGSAIIDSTTPYVQALPSTEDGKIYIYLGIAYSATNVELFLEHPVYQYKSGAIRLWTGP